MRATILAAAIVPCLAAVAAADGGEATLDRFAGEWRWVGDQAEIDALDAAIEACVKKMSFLFRGIARRRLRAPNLPSPRLEVVVDRGNLLVVRPGRPTVAAPADGRPIAWRDPESGQRFTVSHGIERGTMYQRFEGASSLTVNRFTLDGSGPRLVVHTRIEASRLPAPIEFTMSYERIVTKS